MTVSSTVLAVGEPYYDSEGRLEGWTGDPHWIVRFAETGDCLAAASWERLALAVGRASRQFMNIDEYGNFVPFDLQGDTYTPNFVSDPALSPQGVSVYADTKSVLPMAMGEAMLRVLVEELGRLPFDTQVSCYEKAPASVPLRPPYMRPGEPKVIARAMRCAVNNGVPDVVTEYLDAQSNWTVTLSDARVFEPDERGKHPGAWDLSTRLWLTAYEQT